MQTLREVYSLLMPIKDGRIVVPRAAVAEVMGYSKPKERPEDAPDFLLGMVDWQDQKIPLVSFEAARGQGVPELGRRTRIAVVFGIAGRLKPDVFAVVTQGYPYLVRINENVLKPEEMETGDPLILARVRMANEKPYIPDLEELENRIAESLGIAATDTDSSPAGLADEAVDELEALGGGEEEFDAGILDTDEEETFSYDEPEAARESASLDVNENPHSDSPSGDEEVSAVDGNFDVTAFGAETDYSAELGELSAALEGDADETSEAPDPYAIDLSEEAQGNTDADALSFDVDEESPEPVDLSGLEFGEDEVDSPKRDEEEFDLSDIEIEFDDDEDDKKD